MFAIFQSGGKQYRVKAGDKLHVEKLEGEADAKITFNDVLMVGEGSSVTIGAPLVKGASVSAKLVAQQLDEKVIIFKKRRRHNYRRKNGHRQELSLVEITAIAK
ncbi:MAG: 50S ribosomal protein L21 [Dongiaceae bacterium]